MPLTHERINSKLITVGVIGLGYVGLPLACTFAESGVNVVGFDCDEAKLTGLQQGKSYLSTVPDDRLQSNQSRQFFTSTSDLRRVKECDALFLCLPTPIDTHLMPELKYIRNTVISFAPHLSPHTLISLESTTWPGTTEEIVLSILEAHSPYRLGNNLYLAYSPEREDPGNPLYTTKNIPKLVAGANKTSLDLALALYRQAIEECIPVSEIRVAESAKLLENIYRSVNIALVNELKMIFLEMGIDIWEVIQAASTKPFGFMPFLPGPGLGGHCIPTDPFYLSWKAKEYGISTRFIELAGQINRSMPHFVVNKVQDCLNNQKKCLSGSKVLILGLAYKPNVSDMRESPSLELIKLLENKGAIVDYHDPYILEIGKNREYHFLVGKRSREISSEYDCFVLATHHNVYSAKKILSYGVPVVDTRNMFPKSDLVFKA
ncbi:MAG: nucleotide sugar dehydrogenase [Chlamydiales bacterium]